MTTSAKLLHLPAPSHPIHLVASDLDGTLLSADLSVSPRTQTALAAVRARGVFTVPVTARQPHGVQLIAQQAGFEGWALCGNGAFAVNLSTKEVLFEAHLGVVEQTALAHALLELEPETAFLSVRDAGYTFVAQEGYAALSSYSDHKRNPAQMNRHTLGEVLAHPSLKLAARHPRLSPQELYGRVQTLIQGGLGGFSVTYSGAPFLEFMAQGVHKAWGLARLCTHLGIAPENVMAFGDALNDTEMLHWAGYGVAMGQADALLKQSAQAVTLSNAQDGVAAVLERGLAEGWFVGRSPEASYQ